MVCLWRLKIILWLCICHRKATCEVAFLSRRPCLGPIPRFSSDFFPGSRVRRPQWFGHLQQCSTLAWPHWTVGRVPTAQLCCLNPATTNRGCCWAAASNGCEIVVLSRAAHCRVGPCSKLVLASRGRGHAVQGVEAWRWYQWCAEWQLQAARELLGHHIAIPKVSQVDFRS